MYRLGLWALLALAVAPMVSCGNGSEPKPTEVRRVKVVGVQEAPRTTTRHLPGVVRAAQEVSLAFRVAGPILRVHVDEGQLVRAGQLVAELDPRDYQVQLDVAQAQYNQVRAETQRVVELHRRQSVTDADHDKAVAGERMVSAQLAHARNQLNDTRLRAPFDGYIHGLNFRQGELINTGMPLARLVAADGLEVQVDVPTALFMDRQRFVAFHGVGAARPADTVALTLKSYQRVADSHQLYRLYLRVAPDAAGALTPGMLVGVRITLRGPAQEPYQIPLKALFKRDGQTLVWVFDPATSTVVGRRVETDGLVGEGFIRIRSGLRAGEQIVVAGVSRLTEGQRVEPIPPASQTNVGGLL